jgi:hypothetical protein
LLESCRQRDRRVSDALVVILTRGDAEVLAALGTVVEFAIRRAR